MEWSFNTICLHSISHQLNGGSTGQTHTGHPTANTTSNNNNNNNNNIITFGGGAMSGGMMPPGGTQATGTVIGKSSGSGGTSGHPYLTAGRDDSDIGALLGRTNSPGSFLGLSHTSALCGLLEVEPLHFTLHMASDGTKMERASTGTTSWIYAVLLIIDCFEQK